MSRPVFSKTSSPVTTIGEATSTAQGLYSPTEALGKPTAEWTVESTHPKGWCATGHFQPYRRVTTGTSTTTSFTAQVLGRTRIRNVVRGAAQPPGATRLLDPFESTRLALHARFEYANAANERGLYDMWHNMRCHCL